MAYCLRVEAMTENVIESAWKRLFAQYGEQHWWPCKSGNPWEIAAGSVLTQNCAWSNVEKALVRLDAAGITTPEAVLAAPDDVLCDAVRPTGFFSRKSSYLRTAAKFYLENAGEYAEPCRPGPVLNERRARLLAMRGAGRETADSILLYAFHQPVFVIDAYTRRMAARHLNLPNAPDMEYDALQAVFQNALPCDESLYGEYHALIVRHCKESCLKRGCGPVCDAVFGA